jgi:hypothetical protein
MYHKNAALGDIHKAVNWVVADAAALAALVVTVDDLYKFAFQIDTGEVWLLTADTPVWNLINGNSEGPAFSAHAIAAQIIGSGAYADITLDGTLYDSHSAFVSPSFIIPTGWAGIYHFSGKVMAGSDAASKGQLDIRKNGIAVLGGSHSSATSTIRSWIISADTICNEGDIIKLSFIGGGFTTFAPAAGETQRTFFQGHYVRGLP